MCVLRIVYGKDFVLYKYSNYYSVALVVSASCDTSQAKAGIIR